MSRASASWCPTGRYYQELSLGDLEAIARKATTPVAEAVAGDSVTAPAHYTRGGIECIDVIEALGLGFHLGNALKYLWRAGHKGDALEDLRKARWYLEREIARLERGVGR